MVAGGDGWSDRRQLSNPNGLFVDALRTIYVAYGGIDGRVARWYEGMKEGEVIVGGKGRGERPNQLSGPENLSFDRHGNLYIVDYEDHRVQRFTIRTR
jgi:hypothetical protein